MDSIPNNIRICVTLAAISGVLASPVRGLDPNKTISQFTHTAWSAKDGIPGPVQAIAQTPDGYLWLGTRAGLYRFDGLQFISWEAAPGGEKLPRSSITSLFTARDGSLWIGFVSTSVGRLRKGVLRTYTAGDGLLRRVQSFAEDRNGAIWAGGLYGFGRFENERWSRVGAELGYTALGAQQLVVDRQGTLWAATTGKNFGLSKVSAQVNTILRLAANGKQFEATGLPVAYVSQLAEAPDGRTWAAEFGEHAVRPVLGPPRPKFALELQSAPYRIAFDGPSSLWIGSFTDGIRRARDLNHLELASLDRFERADGLSGNGIRSAFQDREGNIWFGTARGLDRFRENKAMPFSTKEGLYGIPEKGITATPDGTVWIMSFASNLVQRIVGGRIVSQTLPPYSQPASTGVFSIYSGKSGHVWLGGSFNLAEATDGKFSYVRVPRTSDKEEGVEAITSDSSGNLWIVVWEGDKPAVRRLRNGSWTAFHNSPELPNCHCGVMFGDALGRVWLGLDGEVAVYENERVRRYSAPDGLPPGRVISIAGDRAGHVWVGSEGGLSRFDGGHFASVTKENGLPGAAVSAILEDEDGFLWLAGPLGIVRVSPQEVERALSSPSYRMQTLFLDTTDGLPGLPVPDPSNAVKTPDGRLWFLTTDGIAVVDPHRLPMNAVPPPVVIQSLTADNRTFTISPESHLRPKARTVEIGFTGLSLSVPERVMFRYKLEGYDNDWHGPTGTRLATYTNLPPRQYRFRVTACNNDGVWNQEGATLDFDIAPMFYQTNWFLVLCGAMAISLLWVVYRWRMRLVTARLDMQYTERLSERERIARELHDTLLQAIQGLMLRFQAAAKGIPEVLPARRVLEAALDRADEVMAEGRDRVRGLRSREGGDDLAQAVTNVAREFGDASHTACRVLVEGDVRSLHPLVRDEVYRIGYEAIVNAFLHAQSREIEVEICYSAKELRIRIHDDGCGIDPSVLASGGKSSHWGVSGMRERASRIRGHLEIRSRAGAGTDVELTVPGGVAYVGASGKAKSVSSGVAIGGRER